MLSSCNLLVSHQTMSVVAARTEFLIESYLLGARSPYHMACWALKSPPMGASGNSLCLGRNAVDSFMLGANPLINSEGVSFVLHITDKKQSLYEALILGVSTRSFRMHVTHFGLSVHGVDIL